MEYVLNELLDTLQYMCFMYIFFKDQLTFSLRKISVVGVIYAISLLTLTMMHQEDNLLITSTIAQIVLIALLSREKWYERFLSFLLLFTLPNILTLSIETIGRFLMGNKNLSGFLTDEYELVGRLITLAITIGCIFFRRRSSELIYVSNSSKGILSAVSTIFMFLLAWMTRRGTTVDEVTGILVGLTSLTIVIASVWTLIIESSRKKLERIEEMAKQYLDYMGLLEKNQIEIRRMNHDFHKHIKTLSLLSKNNEYGKLEEYLKAMGTDLGDRYIDVEYTENTLFNALVSDKMHLANEKGILINCRGILNRDIFISDYEFSVIISNLIDNAIEYVENHKEKSIEIITNHDQDSIFFSITNPLDTGETVDTKNTKKANKDAHGYGLLNVTSIVKKYHGELTLSQEDSLFTASVVLYDFKNITDR